MERLEELVAGLGEHSQRMERIEELLAGLAEREPASSLVRAASVPSDAASNASDDPASLPDPSPIAVGSLQHRPHPPRRASASPPRRASSSLRTVSSDTLPEEAASTRGEEEEEEDYSGHVGARTFRPEVTESRVLHPESQLRVGWDVLMLSLLIYVAILVPLELGGFDMSAPAAWDVVVDLLFIVDIVLNFRTGFFDEAKVLVLDRRAVRRRYLTSWFSLDLISSIPVQILLLIDSRLDDFVVLKLLRLLKLGRLSRVNRIKWLRDLAYKGFIRPGVVRLLKLLLAYFFITHVVSCARRWNWPSFVVASPVTPSSHGGNDWLRAALQTPEEPLRPVGVLQWLWCRLSMLAMPPISHACCTHRCAYWAYARRAFVPCDGSPNIVWGVCEALDGADWGAQYAYSFYWTVAVMLANDPLPDTTGEKLFTTAVVLVGMLVNSVIIGSCASLLANLDTSAVMKQQQFDAINEHLAYHKVSKGLGDSVRSYYDYLWACGHQTDEDALFRQLPDKLRAQLAMVKKRPLIESVDLFQNVTAQCTVDVVDALQTEVLLPREYVTVQGHIGEHMYFIGRGHVQVTQFVSFVERPIRQLSDGGHFGEIALLRADRRRTANVVTLTFCELQVLSRKRFVKLQAKHREFAALVVEASDARQLAEARHSSPTRKLAKSRTQQIVRHGARQVRLASKQIVPRPLQHGARQARTEAYAWSDEAPEQVVLRKTAAEVFAEASRCVAACRQRSTREPSARDSSEQVRARRAVAKLWGSARASSGNALARSSASLREMRGSEDGESPSPSPLRSSGPSPGPERNSPARKPRCTWAAAGASSSKVVPTVSEAETPPETSTRMSGGSVENLEMSDAAGVASFMLDE